MASSIPLLAILASFLILISVSTAISPETINQICAKTINPGHCLNLLKSNHGVASSDLKGVGAIVIDAAASKASQTKSIIPSLLAKASNPALKEAYAACVESYGDALNDIGEAKSALARTDRNGLNIRVSAAQTSVDDCMDILPRSDTSDLKTKSKDLFDTLSVELVISHML